MFANTFKSEDRTDIVIDKLQNAVSNARAKLGSVLHITGPYISFLTQCIMKIQLHACIWLQRVGTYIFSVLLNNVHMK